MAVARFDTSVDPRRARHVRSGGPTTLDRAFAQLVGDAGTTDERGRALGSVEIQPTGTAAAQIDLTHRERAGRGWHEVRVQGSLEAVRDEVLFDGTIALSSTTLSSIGGSVALMVGGLVVVLIGIGSSPSSTASVLPMLVLIVAICEIGGGVGVVRTLRTRDQLLRLAVSTIERATNVAIVTT